MSESIFAIPENELVLYGVAVLGTAELQELMTVLAQRLDAEAVQRVMEEHGGWMENGRFSLPPNTVRRLLAGLEQNNPVYYRQLHERAWRHLAQRLTAGHKEDEGRLTAVFERLATQLVKDNPQTLLTLVHQMGQLPLHTTESQAWQQYFLAVALRKTDQFADSLAIFDQLLHRTDLPPVIRARALNSRANGYCLVGRLEEAIQDYTEGLALWREMGDTLNEGKVLLNLGITAYDLQNYDEAEIYLQAAATKFEQIGAERWLASVQNELGLVYRDKGDLEAARLCFERFVARRRVENSPDQVGRGLNNIGEILLFQGRLDEATAVFHEALNHMTTRVYQIDIHLNLGLAYQATGRLIAAQEAYQNGLSLALEIGRRDILPHIYYHLGDVCRRQNDNAAATKYLELAVQVIEETREPMQDEGLKISLLGRWQQVYEALVWQYLMQGKTAEAFHWAERARARAFAELVGGEQVTQVATAADVQAVLPEDGLMLCYFTTGVLARDLPLLRQLARDNPLREHLLVTPGIVLFVLTNAELTAQVCPLDPNLLVTLSPRGFDLDRMLQTAVLRRLQQSLLHDLPQLSQSGRLYLVPHGPLHQVPFTALLNMPACDGPAVAYAPSATVWLEQQQRPLSALPEKSCLAVGFGGLPEQERFLPYAQAEAEMVAGLLGGEVLTGGEAKKEMLKTAVSQFRWLHFACHGVFNHEQPMESCLETGVDERLTAKEVLHHWRLAAELVVLSACETGVSRILRGDEPMGLIRAFFTAGAQAVLVTQWPVEDLSAFLLMRRFYQRLAQETAVSPAQLLHEAICWLRNLTLADVRAELAAAGQPEAINAPVLANWQEEKRPFAHPRFWAAFTLYSGR
ncbi:MAG: CHAT domain-containing protein [Chloroflexi bacterium]|nr:MAG: CHAT domain-containing protein [Chloroflexota bacterium]